MDPTANAPDFHGHSAVELMLNGDVKGVDRVWLKIRAGGWGGGAVGVPADTREIRLRQRRGGGGNWRRGAIRADAEGGVDIGCHSWVTRRRLVARRCGVIQDTCANYWLD